MRYSNNEIENGIVKNGFDYDLQVWVKDYIIQNLQVARDLKISGKDIREIKREIKRGLL